jgi:exodeoxyribonuclease VII large subunit
LQSVSPLSTLSRGYSITMSNGEAVTSVDTVKENDILMSRVTDGEITSKIVEIRRHQ